jgi:acyl-CoA thioester hydrolase
VTATLDSSIRLADFPHSTTVTTRWNDNDVYGHVNNVEYYALFDTVINAYLIAEGNLDITAGDVIGLCAESRCRFFGPLAFPAPVTAALRVARLGETSVRYELALFADAPEPAATGWFVHVFVARDSRRPHPIPPPLRSCLERLQAD